jgi:hypothetical protein
MGYPNYDRQGLPPIVCLCGSTRFAADFTAARRRETWAGNIVVGPEDMDRNDPDGERKKNLDALHLRKIDLADEVLVLNVGGYIGDSTAREIQYARLRGKEIRYLEAVS